MKIIRLLKSLETSLFTHIVTEDFLIPLISSVPTLSHSVAAYDDSLLSDEVLNSPQEAMPASSSSSSASPSSRSVGHAHSTAQLSPQYRTQEAVEMALSQSLDGSLLGSREMFARHLHENECMLIWHMGSSPSHPVQVVMVWKDFKSLPVDRQTKARAKARAVSKSSTKPENNSSSYNKGKSGAIDRFKNEGWGESEGEAGARGSTGELSEDDVDFSNELPGTVVEGVVMELARNDADMNQLRYLIQNFLVAMRTRPFPRKATAAQDAIKELSDALSISELLKMAPPHINMLTVCCPPSMRAIPWGSLLVEVEGLEGVLVEAPLVERFAVRLGPSLSLFELTSVGASKLKQAVGMHRLCVVSGEENMHHETNSQVEQDCVVALFSSDPDDCTVLAGEYACPAVLRTTPVDEQRRQLVVRRERLEAKVAAKAVSIAAQNAGNLSGEGDVSEEEEELETNGRLLYDLDERKAELVSRALTTCRVLHFSAGKLNVCPVAAIKAKGKLKGVGRAHVGAKAGLRVQDSKGRAKGKVMGGAGLERDMDSPSGTEVLTVPALALPRNGNGKPGVQDGYSVLTAADIVANLYLRNCGLVVLARYGVIDDVPDLRACEPSLEYVDALHFAGACSVMYPVWGGLAQGALGELANNILLLRFYEELSAQAHEAYPVADALRRAQVPLNTSTTLREIVVRSFVCHLFVDQSVG